MRTRKYELPKNRRIMYVGIRPNRRDTFCRSGLTWKRGQVHLVNDEHADVFLKFPTTWIEVDAEGEPLNGAEIPDFDALDQRLDNINREAARNVQRPSDPPTVDIDPRMLDDDGDEDFDDGDDGEGGEDEDEDNDVLLDGQGSGDSLGGDSGDGDGAPDEGELLVKIRAAVQDLDSANPEHFVQAGPNKGKPKIGALRQLLGAEISTGLVKKALG